MPNPKQSHLSTRPPRPEDLVQAVLCLVENLPVADRYIVALVDLVEREHVRRARARRSAA